MLLEEAVLQLLRTAGYTVVEKAGGDPTLHDGHSGLEGVLECSDSEFAAALSGTATDVRCNTNRSGTDDC